ncbi:MAG: 4'-phosphopantetheinyl transferase superfamily protein [bacterium]|nr:4'-phosphopantetheinyl transferase superfamily protein [bacterium]
MEHLLNDLLPATVRVAVAPVGDHEDALLPDERAIVASAVAKRRREFSTGRVLARRLLAEFDHPEFALLRGEDRVPQWPEGLVGSISHADALCAAAVGQASEFAGIGVDLEPDEAVDREIERVVCRDGERAWVRAGGDGAVGRRVRVVFSVKEAVYKAFYPRTREFWGFQDVLVEIDLDAGRYRATLPESAGVRQVSGRVALREGWILSTLAVRANEVGAPGDAASVR